MPLNWPAATQGSGIGTTYIGPSPSTNVWTWTGYAWLSNSSGNLKGQYGGPWVIFNQYGEAFGFSTLPEALNNSFVMDESLSTINLICDTKEIVNTSYYVRINKNVNINLNGYTYTLDANSNTSLTGIVISNSDVASGNPTSSFNQWNLRIYDGTIKLINVINQGQQLALIGEIDYVSNGLSISDELNPFSYMDWYFHNVTFESDVIGWYVGIFRSNVYGGRFYANPIRANGNNSPSTAVLFSGVFTPPPLNTYSKKSIIFRDVEGISENGTGIEFVGATTGCASVMINCVGKSRATSYSQNVFGIKTVSPIIGNNISLMHYAQSRLVNCKGIIETDQNIPSVAGAIVPIAIDLDAGIQAINCQGIAHNGIGIRTKTTLITGCQAYNSHETIPKIQSLGGSVIKLSAVSSQINTDDGIAFKTTGNISLGSTGDRIHNSTFYSGYGVWADSLPPGSLVEISNSSIRAKRAGVYIPEGPSGLLIVANSSIRSFEANEGSYFGMMKPIIARGASSIILNNFLGALNGCYAITPGTTSQGVINMYMANNVCENVQGLFDTTSVIINTITSSSDSRSNTRIP